MIIINTIILTSTIIITIWNHVSIGVTLLIQTILLTTLINEISSSSWFSIITFLIITGGLLILFTYMSSMNNINY